MCLKAAYLQVAILKEQPGILRVSPVGSGGPLPYEGFAQDPLVLMPRCWLVTPFQGTLGNPPQGLLPDGQGGGAGCLIEGRLTLRHPACKDKAVLFAAHGHMNLSLCILSGCLAGSNFCAYTAARQHVEPSHMIHRHEVTCAVSECHGSLSAKLENNLAVACMIHLCMLLCCMQGALLRARCSVATSKLQH